MYHRVTRREPSVRPARKELDQEFAGAVTHLPSHGRVNHKQIPSIPYNKPHHLQFPPKCRGESAMHFLQNNAGLPWDVAHYINLQIGGKLHALLRMNNQQIKHDVRATYPWQSTSEYLKCTVTDKQFAMLFAALDKERATPVYHDSNQFASNSDIQNPFFV